MISGCIYFINFINTHSISIYFRTWETGFCHTYNPAELQSPEFDERIGLFLGHNYMNKDLRKLNFTSESSGFIFMRMDSSGQKQILNL